jgi:hypothetical protein
MTLTVPPARVARLLDALEHLEIPDARPGVARSGELRAPRAQLREVLLVAIDEAGEALSGECTAMLRGSGSAELVRAGVEELSGLLDLLESVERGPSPGQPSSR